MYQSIPSLHDHPPPPQANPWRIFLKGQLFSNIQQNNMNETETTENNTKMLICLKHLKA